MRSDLLGILLSVVVASITAGHPVGASVALGPATFRRACADPRIPGLGHDDPVLGGRLYVGLRNTGASPVHIEGLRLNDTDAETLMREQRLYWWRVWPEEIPAGGFSTMTIQGGAPLLQEGASVDVSLRASDGSVAKRRVDMVTPALRIAYAVPEPEWRSMLVWLRNDDDLRALQVRDVSIAGAKSSCHPLARVIAPGRSTIVRLRLNNPLRLLQPLQVIAQADDDRGRRVECMAPLRALIPPFPIGTWDGPTYDAQHLDAMAVNGFDGLINGGSQGDVEAMKRLSAGHGYGLLSHVGWGPGKAQQFVLDHIASEPWCLALALMDEPDLHSGKDTDGMRASTFTYLGGIEVWRKCALRPTFVNLCDDRKFSEFSAIADITGYDAYAIGAPGIERSHVGYARDLETLAYYTWDLKRNAEPSPVWVWAQGYGSWVGRLLAGVLAYGQPGRAMVTPSECRVQLIEQLGRGAKGVWWFIARSREDTCKGFESELKEEGAEFGVTPDRFPALAAKAMEPWDDLWGELGRLNSIMRQLRPLLTYGDPYQQFIRDVEWTARADIATITCENALVVFAANLDYYHTLQGAWFRPIQSLSLTVERPAWLKVADVFEVTPQGPRDVKWSASRQCLSLDAGTLADIRIFVAATSHELRCRLAACALPPVTL